MRKYQVTDSYGHSHEVEADEMQVNGSQLKFYRKGEESQSQRDSRWVCAVFHDYANVKVVGEGQGGDEGTKRAAAMIDGLAQPQPAPGLNPAEAVFGVMGWLTSRDALTVLSGFDDASVGAAIAQDFVDANGLGDVSEHWPRHMRPHPVTTASNCTLRQARGVTIITPFGDAVVRPIVGNPAGVTTTGAYRSEQAAQNKRATEMCSAAEAEPPAKLIIPTVGRKVWFYPSRPAGSPWPHGMSVAPGMQPLDATVIYVHDDRLVNLLVVDHYGKSFPIEAVQLMQPGDPLTVEHRAEWMPYQLEQANKLGQADKA